MVKNQALPLQGAFVGELKSHAGAAKKKKKKSNTKHLEEEKVKGGGRVSLKGQDQRQMKIRRTSSR